MIEIHTYSDKPLSVEQISETFEAAFNQKFDTAYWNWRFLQNPVSSKVYIAYILDGKRLAAYYAVSPVMIKHESETFKFALSNMTMTHPDDQGKGYFKMLAKRLFDELQKDAFDGVIGFANHNSHYGFKKHLGWYDLSALMLFQSAKNITQLEIPKAISFYDSDVNAEILDKIKNMTCGAPAQFHFSRDLDFIKWRFLEIPNKNYRVLIQTEQEIPVSATVYKLYGTEIDLMEQFNQVEITDSEKLRIQYSIGFLQKQYQAVVNLWSNIHSLEHLVLEKSGFKETSFSTYFGIIPFTERSLELKNFNNWHFRFTDSDVF